MRNVFKSSFLRLTLSGFVLGVMGMLTLQPASATHGLLQHVAHAAHVAR